MFDITVILSKLFGVLYIGFCMYLVSLALKDYEKNHNKGDKRK